MTTDPSQAIETLEHEAELFARIAAAQRGVLEILASFDAEDRIKVLAPFHPPFRARASITESLVAAIQQRQDGMSTKEIIDLAINMGSRQSSVGVMLNRLLKKGRVRRKCHGVWIAGMS